MEKVLTPLTFCTGTGSEADPYHSQDGTAGIQQSLADLEARGGLLRLPCARYDITKTILFNISSARITGDIWAYNSDPNGVFETNFGTKLRLQGKGFPAIRIGADHTLGGNRIQELGIQGDIKGMDTRASFSLQDPTANAGLVLDAVRTDQCSYEKISFCGLGAGIAVSGNAEVDACNFDRCNADGCGVGFYFVPRAAFYARVHRCLLADTPYYGAFVDGTGKHIHNLELTECFFVRNGGCLTKDMPGGAAVTMLNVCDCAVERNNFDDPGTFWYYEPTATENRQRQPSKQAVLALYLKGNKNRIRDNIFQHTKGTAVCIEGDYNVLTGNITDGDVIISGKGNYICGLALQKEARLILTAEATDTVVFGVPEERIVRQ